jgi:hypothetical protein
VVYGLSPYPFGGRLISTVGLDRVVRGGPADVERRRPNAAVADCRSMPRMAFRGSKTRREEAERGRRVGRAHLGRRSGSGTAGKSGRRGTGAAVGGARCGVSSGVGKRQGVAAETPQRLARAEE